jgi:undecaprenyl-diphosphatase
VFRRTRPSLDGVPLIRHVRRAPVTTSFPSGHAASAAAFTTGVSLELPELAVPVGTLAAAVAYSRVHVGVHYPGDVLVGAALGAGLALATAAFRRTGRR